MPIEAWGLVLNAIGAILVAYGQARVSGVVYMWLRSHEIFIRTYVEQVENTIIRITGVDDRMVRALKFNRWVGVAGWTLFVIGVALQLVPFFKTGQTSGGHAG